MGEGKKLTMQAVANRKDAKRLSFADSHVDQQYDKGIALLEKGYSGPAASSSRSARAAGARG